jgi:hypothetical protein
MATEQAPAANDILSKYPGLWATLFAVVTGVVFIGALYISASGHGGGDHGGGEHAEGAGEHH